MIKIKQTLTTIILILGISSGIGLAAVDFASATSCDGVETSIINCTSANDKTVKSSGLWQILLIAINILTAGVGVAAVAGLVYGGIMYASAAGSAEQTKKALDMITNVVIGIIVYVLMYSLLNYLVPGGMFSS